MYYAIICVPIKCSNKLILVNPRIRDLEEGKGCENFNLVITCPQQTKFDVRKLRNRKYLKTAATAVLKSTMSIAKASENFGVPYITLTISIDGIRSGFVGMRLSK